MAHSIFISYVYEDIRFRNQLKEWANNGLLGSDIKITHEREDCRQHGDNAIKEELKSMIQGASAVIFLIGQNSHNHNWVEYEAQCSISKNKLIILTRIPGTTGQRPMSLLRHPEISMNIQSLKSALTQ